MIVHRNLPMVIIGYYVITMLLLAIFIHIPFTAKNQQDFPMDFNQYPSSEVSVNPPMKKLAKLTESSVVSSVQSSQGMVPRGNPPWDFHGLIEGFPWKIARWKPSSWPVF